MFLHVLISLTQRRPRSSAAAEVMWSGRYDEDKVKRDIGDAMPRLFDWRYRLLKRGIQAEAIQPLWW
jgi:hexosaminidase